VARQAFGVTAYPLDRFTRFELGAGFNNIDRSRLFVTRDVTGEEFYSTLYAISESPLEAGVIWTGSNDGPFYVTRDGLGKPISELFA